MSPYYDAPMFDERQPCTVACYLTDELTDRALAFVDGEATRDEPFGSRSTTPRHTIRGSIRIRANTATGNPATDEGYGVHARA